MSIFLPLTDPGARDSARVGRKAATLARLLQVGFPVPPGLCLPAAVFQAALAPFWPDITPLLERLDPAEPASAAGVSAAVLSRLTDLSLPSAFLVDLAETLSVLGPAGTPLAVRSSATAEDLPGTSYAGRYDTVLGPSAPGDAAHAILTCWRSAFSAPALAERGRHGRLDALPAMAVLLQPLLTPACAGVLLSVDPVARRRDRLVISAAWGLGAGVADGRVPGDAEWVRRDTLDLDHRRVAVKDRQIVLGPDGVIEAAVPAERVALPCLPAAWRRRLAQYGLALEQAAGRPQDVEWAIADGQVWILQSRALTALPPELAETPPFPVEWIDAADARRFWSLRPLPDRPADVLRPLELDQVDARVGASRDGHHFAGRDPVNTWRVVNGRLYEGSVPNELSPGDRRVRWQLLLDLNQRLEATGQTNWDYWGPEIVSAIERLRAFDSGAADGPALAAHVEDALGTYRRLWMFHGPIFVRDTRPLREAFATVTGLTGESGEQALQGLLEGEETVATAIVDRLYALAVLARATPGLPERLAAGVGETLTWLEATDDAEAFRAALDSFLADFGQHNGDGYGSEATLLTPTWAEAPALVLELVAAYLSSDGEPPSVVRRRARQARDEREAALLATCDDAAAIDRWRALLAQARRDRQIMDEHNHAIDQSTLGCLRLAVLAAARWLVARGDLASVEDVFWLRAEEIVAALRRQEPHGLAPIVTARRAEVERLSHLEAPACLGVPPAGLPARPAEPEVPLETGGLEASSPALLRGLGASPGRATGRARIVLAGTLRPDLGPGDILVAHNAGPLWTPYFPLLAGIVLQEGSLGQHAAITAREYGVPAVVQVPDAIRLIPDGAGLALDGEEGTVKIIEDFGSRISDSR